MRLAQEPAVRSMKKVQVIFEIKTSPNTSATSFHQHQFVNLPSLFAFYFVFWFFKIVQNSQKHLPHKRFRPPSLPVLCNQSTGLPARKPSAFAPWSQPGADTDARRRLHPCVCTLISSTSANTSCRGSKMEQEHLTIS